MSDQNDRNIVAFFYERAVYVSNDDYDDRDDSGWRVCQFKDEGAAQA